MIKRLLNVLHRNSLFFLYGNEIGFISKIRLKLAGRNQLMSISFKGKKILISDAAGFVRNYEDVFINRCYDFQTTKEDPFIIDCGSNVGLSVLFFKLNHPGAIVVAFEPDPQLFDLLNANVASFELKDVELVNAALWNEEKRLAFEGEHNFSGKIQKSGNSTLEVDAVELNPYMKSDVDFLKIDIEGAETEVLQSCKDDLGKVKCLFFEYHSFPGEEQTLDQLLTIVKNAGFRYAIKEESAAQNPYKKEQSSWPMDLQLAVYCYR